MVLYKNKNTSDSNNTKGSNDKYEIFSISDRWNYTFIERIYLLLSQVNTSNLDLPLLPWYVIQNTKTGSIKLKAQSYSSIASTTFSGDSDFPITYFRKYRNPLETYGFLSGVVYKSKYWSDNNNTNNTFPQFQEGWTNLLPTIPPSSLIDCINFYMPPNGKWFIEVNNVGMISLRGGTPYSYYPVIHDYRNYYFGKKEMYWLLVGIAYALCPK